MIINGELVKVHKKSSEPVLSLSKVCMRTMPLQQLRCLLLWVGDSGAEFDSKYIHKCLKSNSSLV